MTDIESITKDLDHYRTWQQRFMISICVLAIITIGLKVYGLEDLAVWSSMLLVCSTLGQTYFTSKTAGIARNIAISNHDLSETNNRLAEENNELITKLSKQVSGGSGFCYIQLAHNPRGGEARVFLISNSEYSLYSISITISGDPFVTYEESQKKDPLQLAEETKNFRFTIPYEIPEFKPGILLDLGYVPYSNARRSRYYITFHVRDGRQWIQRYTFVSRKEYIHYVVIDGEYGNGEVLLELAPYDKSMEADF